MDDTALPIEAADAGDIFGMLEMPSMPYCELPRPSAFRSTFAPGKTEAVLGLYGRGLSAARQRLADLEVEAEGGRIPMLPIPGAGFA